MDNGREIGMEPAVILSELNALESDFYEFQKMARTFNGWALTLGDDEFNELMIDFGFVNGKKSMVPPKYGVLEYIFEGKTKFALEEFNEDLKLKGEHLKKIGLFRMGFCTYTPSEYDKDWDFIITKAGAEKAEGIELQKQGKDGH